jgi:hypothetical protein
VERTDEIRIVHGGGQHLLGQAAVEMDEVRGDGRLELGESLR